jgi:hypothetical protein
MAKVILDLARPLDGSKPEMLAILVDSYGDKLLIDNLNCERPIEPADHFIPCPMCGNPVLACNYEAGQEACDRCRKKELESFDRRKAVATQAASDAFWAVIVEHFPESNDGAFLMSDMDDIMRSWVDHWVDLNVPKQEPEPKHQTYRGDRENLDDLNLHYPETWHLMHTGGGCMVAITDNVAVNCQHNYLAVTSECVCIYQDKFDQDTFLMDPIATWFIGDNPTVLMNQIDEFMGSVGYWDTGKLFDDIISLAKSDKL